jgi:hypothetical protein
VEASISLIPNYLKATKLEKLRGLMLETNLRLGQQVHYFDIQFVGKEWIAWYYEEVDFSGELQKQTAKVE